MYIMGGELRLFGKKNGGDREVIGGNEDKKL